MNDNELLELAAKAAGYRVRWVAAFTSLNRTGFRMKTGNVLPGGLGDIEEEVSWNPLESDGDALRLAVKLGIVFFSHVTEPKGDDPYAATRRAIVLAAAELGATHD